MKVLKGTLKESLYNWPDQCPTSNDQAAVPVLKRETMFSQDEVTYISGSENSQTAFFFSDLQIRCR
jgi:cysteine dioxygenase